MRVTRRLARDCSGATLIEFALLAPALIVLLLGLFEMGYNYYTQAQLQGAVQRAARESSTQSANSNHAQVDANVAEAVHYIAPGATLKFSRKAYSSFSDVHRAEDYDDLNKDNVCNDGEPFEDANGNGLWDSDRGAIGGGGARDAVLYVVDVTYNRAFGAARFFGASDTFTTQAVTVLRNQPWDGQEISSKVGNCT